MLLVSKKYIYFKFYFKNIFNCRKRVRSDFYCGKRTRILANLQESLAFCKVGGQQWHAFRDMTENYSRRYAHTDDTCWVTGRRACNVLRGSGSRCHVPAPSIKYPGRAPVGQDLLNEWALTCRNNLRGRGNNGPQVQMCFRGGPAGPSVSVNNARFTNNRLCPSVCPSRGKGVGGLYQFPAEILGLNVSTLNERPRPRLRHASRPRSSMTRCRRLRWKAFYLPTYLPRYNPDRSELATRFRARAELMMMSQHFGLGYHSDNKIKDM